MIHKIEATVVFVQDLAGCTVFYRDTFKLKYQGSDAHSASFLLQEGLYLILLSPEGAADLLGTQGNSLKIEAGPRGLLAAGVGAAAHELGLHPISVRRWIQARRSQAVPIGREVRVPHAEIERPVGKLDERLLVLYGRVSEHGQKVDLDIQLERLPAWAKTERKGLGTLVLCDLGSGLKASRRQLQHLLKLVCEDKVGEIAITYEDRLTRLGQEYLQTLFACFDVTLTVLEPGEEKTPEQELTHDLLALIASFSGRLYGMRSHKQQALVACAKQVLAGQEE